MASLSAIHLEWNPIEQQLESLRALVEELRRKVGDLRAENAELRREVGYWQSMHARAIERNTKLQSELEEAKAEIRQRRDYSHLPARIQEVDVPDDAKVCACCGLPLEDLAMKLFSIFATLSLWKINPRRWRNWYFEACANSGGKAPFDVAEFLPWNLSPALLSELQNSTAGNSNVNSS